MGNFHYTSRLLQSDAIFSMGGFEPANYFFFKNNCLPIILHLTGVDGEKGYTACTAHFVNDIEDQFVSRYTELNETKSQFKEATILLNDGTVVRFVPRAVTILTKEVNEEKVAAIRSLFSKSKVKGKKKKFEINLITQYPYGLDLKKVKIKKTKLDLNKYYNDDFLEIDKLLLDRLNNKNDKGIVLLHGEPGTGKTTYLRYLIGRLKKKVLVLPSNLAHFIVNPDFIEILINNPNSIVIIEDTENIIKDRQNGDGGVVSNLLNMSDGLLADCLNTQLICTFNCPVSKIDAALLRKGRLIARYEFLKLNPDKVKALNEELEIGASIDGPMTIGDLIHFKDKNFADDKGLSIGFNK